LWSKYVISVYFINTGKNSQKVISLLNLPIKLEHARYISEFHQHR